MKNNAIPMLLLSIGCQSEKGVTVFNAKPDAQITSHSDGAVLQEGFLISFRGTVTDPNHSHDLLTASWYSDQGLLCEGVTPESDGVVQCDAILDPSVSSIQLEVSDPQNATGVSLISVTVNPTEAPSASIALPLSTGQYYSEQLIEFEGLLEDAEDSPELLTGHWESSLDGLLTDVTVEPDSSGLVSGFGYLSEGEHALQLHVVDSTGKTNSDSVVIAVGPPNSPPACEILEPAPDSVGAFVELVSLRAAVSDPDVPSDWLTVSWESDKDGPLGESTPSSDGEVLFSTDTLSVNTHTLSMTVQDELGLSCTALLSYTVGTPPVLSLNRPTPNEIFSEGTIITFEATVSDSEDLPNEVALDWLLDGQAYSSQGADSTGVVLIEDGHIAVGSHTLSVTATDTDGLFVTQSLGFQVDGLPSAATVQITPSNPQTGDDLQAAASGSIDPEGNPVSYAFEWLQNGQATVYTSATVPAVATTKAEVWTVRVTPNDGLADGPLTEANVMILNTAPAISGLVIDPVAPSSQSSLTCTPQSSDADGDPLTIGVSWQNLTSGMPLGIGNPLVLSSSAAQPGDLVQCTVTVDDGDGGLTTDAAQVTVSNTAPTVLSVTLAPSTVFTDGLLTASAAFDDVDGQSVSADYVWHVVDASNGNLDSIVQSGSTTTLSGVVHFDRDDLVYVTVTPNDGLIDGTPLSSSILAVQNTAPDSASISLSPDPATLVVDDLVCEVIGPASDADGDAIFYSYGWEAPDGSLVQTTGPTAAITDTLSASNLSQGDWTCRVTPFDGTVSGPVSSAAALVEGGCQSVSFQPVSHIDLGAATSLMQPNTELTVELWARWDGYWAGGPNYAPVLIGNIASFSGGGWNIALESGDWNIGARTTGGNLSIGAGLADAEADPNRWTHVVAQFENSVSGSSASLFINGNLVGNVTNTDPLYFAGDELLTLANQPDHYDDRRQFTGEIATLRISDVHRYSGAFTPDTNLLMDSNTLGLWTFSEASGTIAAGQGTAAVDAQLYSASWLDTCPSEDVDLDGLLAWEDCDDVDGLNVAWGSGESADCPANRCLDILEDGFSVGDGSYWIDPSGTGAFEAWCDMTTEGGGWTQVARGIGAQQAGWATSGALNPTGFDDLTQTFKLSDAQINAIDRTVLRYSGENSVLADWYWDGGCVYNHVGINDGLCNCAHDSPDLLGISWCGDPHPEHYGMGDWSGGTVFINGYGTSNTHGYLHTNTGGGRNHWYMRDMWADEDGTRCEGYMSGCDIGLYVR